MLMTKVAAGRCMLPLLLTSLLLACSIQEGAAYTPLGCFNLANVRAVAAPATVKPGPTACSNYCRSHKYPLFGIMCMKRCVCSGELPVAAARSNSPTCRQALTSGCKTVNLAYINAVGRCSYSPLSFKPANLDIPSGADRISFQPNGDKMTISLYDTMGARAEAHGFYTYGMYSMRAQAAAGNGLVSAFYLSSTKEVPPTGGWDEIDYEFINYHNFAETPGLTWTNTFKDGQSVKSSDIAASKVASVLRSPGFRPTDAMATYTIDWQPSYVRWYVNGKLLDERTSQIPSKPMHLAFTLWGRNDWAQDCKWWGGCIENWQKGQAVFQSARRVLCK